MDVSQAIAGYINKIVAPSDTSSAKMKILLLDRETVGIVSTAITQSSLLNHEVYLIDRLDNANREKMRHLRCLCLVRPSAESIQLLIDELRDPKYGEYYLYFTNVTKKSSLERLAEADDHEVVKLVQEHFADYTVINPDLFSFNLTLPQRRVWAGSPDTWNPDTLQRCAEGLIAVLLSLKKKPFIRYEKNSLMAKKLATEVRYLMTQEEQLFDFRKVDTPPILLVLDRREDPVTPLLTQWTYQAMVHHLIGIHNGRVEMGDIPDIRPELKEIVLSQDQDPFFKKNMFMNFGDLGGNIKDYVSQFQSKTQTNENIDSISDMKRFIEEYPEFRKLSGNVSKHVTLVSELSRRVGAENLLEVSELEQSLACNDNHSADLKVSLSFRNTSRIMIDSLVEHSTPDPVSECNFQQQSRTRRLIRPSISKTPIKLFANAHRPPCRRRKCSPSSSRAGQQSIGVSRISSIVSSSRRDRGLVRLCWHFRRCFEGFQGPKGRRKRIHSAQCITREHSSESYQRTFEGATISLRRGRRVNKG